MKLFLKINFVLTLLFLSLGGCSEEKYVGLKRPAADYALETHPLRMRHKDAPLKILAVGNSFTSCAVNHLPRMIKYLNADSICLAKLVRNGATLSMHWTSHWKDSPDYEMYYSDGGEFVMTDIATIDEALDILDWDVIVIQQSSGIAGVYSTYQPALSHLLALFRESNPEALTAWQYTWAYMPGTKHADFFRYGYNPDSMYAAVIDVCDRICDDMAIDIRIPSATLVRRLREAFPEVEDGFSPDGFHIDMTGLGGYALSALWYECLVAPFSGVSCVDSRLYFNIAGAAQSDLDTTLDIVGDVAAISEGVKTIKG